VELIEETIAERDGAGSDVVTRHLSQEIRERPGPAVFPRPLPTPRGLGSSAPAASAFFPLPSATGEPLARERTWSQALPGAALDLAPAGTPLHSGGQQSGPSKRVARGGKGPAGAGASVGDEDAMSLPGSVSEEHVVMKRGATLTIDDRTGGIQGIKVRTLRVG
jgi:hypothetical protein